MFQTAEHYICFKLCMPPQCGFSESKNPDPNTTILPTERLLPGSVHLGELLQRGQVWVVGLQQNLQQIHPGLIGVALANHARVASLQEDHLGPEQKLSYDAENDGVCQNNGAADAWKTTQRKERQRQS